MNIIIFANGVIENLRAEVARWIQPGDLIVAADGGTRHALAAGVLPIRIIGDLDSLDADLRAYAEAAGMEFHVYPPAKDETDLELALLWAVEQSAEVIVILGAMGGRPDQELANLLLLALPALAGRKAVIVNGTWVICCIRGGEAFVLRGTPGDTVSLIPLGGDAHGVTTQGLVYPLHNETLYFGQSRGVSNVMAGEEAMVTVEDGLLWCLCKETHAA